jgi:hypothetical protein
VGPIGLWDTEDRTLSWQSAHRWWKSCQPYVSAAPYPRIVPVNLLQADSTPRPQCCWKNWVHWENSTGSLWWRQSQQSFNTLTPLNSLFYSLHVSAPTGHSQMIHTISCYFCFLKNYFNATDPLHEMLFVVIGFSTYSPNTCSPIKYKNQNCKISKIYYVTSGVVTKL